MSQHFFIVVFQYILIYNVEFKVWLICDPFFVCVCVLQSKEIGIQMHEELVKVTNELYTVSIMSLNLSLFIFPALFFSLFLWMELSPAVSCHAPWKRWLSGQEQKQFGCATVWRRKKLLLHSFLLKDGKLKQGIVLRE